MSVSRFKPGQSGNPNGRPKGVANKVTKQLRQSLKNIIAGELDKLPALLDELEPKDRLELTIKLMRYCMPPAQPMSATAHEPRDFDMDF